MRNSWRTKVYGVIFALISFSLGAQSPVSYQAEAEYGFLFLHSQDVAPIGQSYPAAFALNIQRWLLADPYWASCNCYPKFGLSFGAHYYDNPEVLGWGIPLYGYLEPWYRLGNDWYFTLRASAGLIYLSRPFDSLANPLNFSYSLPLSAYLSMGLGVGYQVNEYWRLSLQARYNHTSNGGIREPNKGLNYPTLALGVDWSIDPVLLRTKSKKVFDFRNRRKQWSATGFLGAKAGATVGEGAQEQDVTYLVSGLALKYSYQIARTSAFTGGVEYISNLAYRRQINRAGGKESHRQFALSFGHEFLLGKFVFSQEAGIYLFKEFGAQSAWYQRYALLYRPWKDLSIGPGLKAHANVAEFLDFRVTWDLPI